MRTTIRWMGRASGLFLIAAGLWACDGGESTTTGGGGSTGGNGGAGAAAGAGGDGGTGGATATTTTTEPATTTTTTSTGPCVPEDDANECTDDTCTAEGTTHAPLSDMPCEAGAKTCFSGHCLGGAYAGPKLDGCSLTVEYKAFPNELGDLSAQTFCFTEDVTVTGFVLWVVKNAGCAVTSREIWVSAPGPEDPNGAMASIKVSINAAEIEGDPGSGIPAQPFVDIEADRFYILTKDLLPFTVSAGACVQVAEVMGGDNCVPVCQAHADSSPIDDGAWCTTPTADTWGGCSPMSGPYPGVNKASEWLRGLVYTTP